MENKEKIKDADGIHGEKASARSEAEIRYSAVFDQSPDGILLIDADGKIIDFNEAAHTDLGYSREEFSKFSISDIDPLESPDEIRAHIRRRLNEDKAQFEVTHRTKSGELRNVLVIAQTIVLSGQTVQHAIWRDITEQKAMDKKVRYLASILEHVPDAVCSIDTEGRIVSWNEGAELILGYKAGEIIGRPIQSIIPEEKAHEEMKHCIGALNKEGVFTGHDTVRVAKDGRRVPVEISGLALREGRKITGYASIMRDLSSRLNMEHALAESEAKYRDLFENASDAVFVLDSGHRFVDVNRRGLELLGHTREELLGRNPFDFIPEGERPLLATEFDKLKRTGFYEAFEGRVLTKDGRWIDIEVSSTAIFRDGAFAGSRDIVRDITSRRRLEGAMRLQSEIAGNIAEGVYLVSVKDLSIVYANPKMEEMFGYGPGEMKDKHVSLINAPTGGDPVRTARQIDEALAELGVWRGEVLNIRKDGTPFWGHASISKIHLPEFGDVYVSLQTDITERKRMDEKLRQSEAFIRNILDTVDEGFIVIDRDFRIMTANKAYCSQVGEPCDSVIGRHCYEISHKILRPCHEEGEECAVLHVFGTGEPHASLHKHPDAKGSILYVETKAFPIKDSSGTVTSVIETVNNITEKHLLEEEQLKTQKLEAIGTLAGGIAHDFNNLLQGVFGYISMAKMTLDQKEHSLAMLEQAEKALHMSVNLTTQLLTFSKGGKPEKKKIQLKSVIENSVRFALSGSSVGFRNKFDDNLWTVDADEGQIGQVIQNIVLNADQAMPTGGKIVISAKNVCAPGEGLPPSLPEGKYVEISVKDNGIGIPEQYIPRLFDPYFTTKEKGSGLGLATSYSIIKNHGGLIDVKSQLGNGSTFFIYLPAVEADEERAGIIPAADKIIRKGRILLMDDEEVVRTIVGIMIGSLGHELEFAENGAEAIAKYRAALLSGKRFDIVILDLTVRGGMGGEEALRELLALDPEVKAVVSSGYADSATIAEYESRGFSASLTKPYEVDALRDILNLLLN